MESNYQIDDCELFEKSVYLEEISDMLCIAFSGKWKITIFSSKDDPVIQFHVRCLINYIKLKERDFDLLFRTISFMSPIWTTIISTLGR